MASTIFYEGDGNIPARVLCTFIFEHELFRHSSVIATADTEWEDGSPSQLRFELDVTYDEADTLVSQLNSQMEAYGCEPNWFVMGE